ncbi:MAG: hypothetical protein RUMPE_01323 [Eubacteriales bacterium SKADARSKE-1]|nr:hypothetical protein [Eubacteriales bacterium SKADARSKE-1]
MVSEYENIPNELKQLNQWICFKLVYNEEREKYDKIPKNPHNGYNAKANDPKTWSDYETAIKAVSKYEFEGIGFEFANRIFGIDLDHCIDKDGKLSDEARDIVNIMDSYSEVSPSGSGLHILCIGETPVRGARKGAIEMYSTGRFFTVTGSVLEGKNKLEQRSEQAKIIYQKYLKNEPEQNENQSKFKCTLSDEEIIEKAMHAKNGFKFEALWRGDISGYKSESEKDLALCNILAFYCGDNFDHIDSLFCKSGLYREKWDRPDYKSATINKAIEDCEEFYEDKSYLKSIPLYPYIYQQKDKYFVNCPLLAKYIRENTNYFFVKDSSKGGTMRYFYKDGVYQLYNEDMVKGFIKKYVTNFDESVLKMRDITEVFNDLSTDLVFTNYEKVNANENIINFQNGVLNLETMQLLPHSPKYYSTIQIPCNWESQATDTPIFDNFINTLIDGDEGIKKLILQFIGACLSNIKGYRMKKALFMVGKGNTGKSQLKSLVEKLLGKGNYCGIDLRELESRFGTSNIYNKRLAGSSDMSYMTVGELKTFKKCTGGDSLFAEFKGENGFEFTYNGLLWFCMNQLPKFGGDNGKWVYDRIIQIACNNVVPLERQDKFLLEKMYEEREGIVYRAIIAFLEVIENRYEFAEPSSVTRLREDYRAENSTIISFYKDCVTERSNNFLDDCTAQKTYQIYKAWCADNNHGYAKTAKEFRKEFSEILGGAFENVTIIKKGYTYYKAVTLARECKDTYQKTYGHDGVYNNIHNFDEFLNTS